MDKNLEISQLVLCTVTKIVGTTVFVQIDDYNRDGTITFMEIAPGRIRNIREYAFPGKKIVCKVMSIKPDHVELSFRRVKVNERNEFNDKYKRERSYSALFRTILGEQESEAIIQKIKSEKKSFFEFLEEAKENEQLLEKYIKKEFASKILGILKEKKAKETSLSKKFSLASKNQDGIVQVKETIKKATESCKDCEVSYLAAGKYILKLKTKDLKAGDQKLRKIIENLENISKKNSCIFAEDKG